MKKFEELRNEYSEFIYKSYNIEEDKDTIKIKYCFEIPELATFNPTIEIEKRNIDFKSINNDFAENIVFSIGMIELISYWKCACPKKVIIKCGMLNKEQIDWFKKLYYYGLGEYRYINNIEISMDDMMEIIIDTDKEYILDYSKINNSDLKGVLIPIGGGKDSCVTAELLKDQKDDNLCLIVGGKEPSIKSAELAGYKDKIVYVRRTIDKNLLELNKKGFLNGHTPFSSMLAFLSYLVAYLTGKKYIALSNEASSNENNVAGEKINHQYSKSFEFEQDFRFYADKYLKGNIEYFSMLRPISELQIGMLFAKYEKYHNIFRSCNVGSKSIPWEWCGRCPKCLFVYIILSPFLYKDRLVQIFNQDLYENKELLNTFIDLCGFRKNKAFRMCWYI